MLQIERYIAVEILKPLVSVCGILVGLFVSFSMARLLAASVSESMGGRVLLELVVLKTFIALEVLVPVSLYVAVVVGLGRLYRDQEITALRASGVGSRRVVSAVLLLAVPTAIMVFFLSNVARPWAYARSYVLDARARAEFNTDRLQAGRFYGNDDSGRVLYADGRNAAKGALESVFIFHRNDTHGTSELILAREASRRQPSPEQRVQLHLRDGTWYRLARSAARDETVRFAQLVFFLKEPEESIGYKRKAVSTGALFGSDLSADTAELEWRLSRPVATLLLALVAIPLSRVSPREGKHERIVMAMLVFAVYYNLSALAQTWVEQGVVGAIPGVWWLHALMLMAVAAFLRPEFRKTLAAQK